MSNDLSTLYDVKVNLILLPISSTIKIIHEFINIFGLSKFMSFTTMTKVKLKQIDVNYEILCEKRIFRIWLLNETFLVPFKFYLSASFYNLFLFLSLLLSVFPQV